MWWPERFHVKFRNSSSSSLGCQNSVNFIARTVRLCIFWQRRKRSFRGYPCWLNYMNNCLRKRLRSGVVSEFFEPQKTIFPLPNLIHATDGHQKLRHTTSHQRRHFEVLRNQIEQMVLGEVLCAKNAASR